MTSLETLPLEIHEQIFAYLVPRQRHRDLYCLDSAYWNEKERPDIYNVRLTCRRLRTAALQTFVWILEDLPTKCQENTLRNLAALLELPEIASRLTYLTLSPYHLFMADRYSDSLDVIIDSPKDEFHARCAWLRDTLSETLVAIIRQAPKIRHLVCVVASLSLTFNQGEHAWVGTIWSEAIDPMHVSSAPQPSNGLFENLAALCLPRLLGGSSTHVDELHRSFKPSSKIHTWQKDSNLCTSSPVNTSTISDILATSLKASLL